MTSAARRASSSVVRHDDTLMRIAGSPRQTVGPHHTRPSACTAAITADVVPGAPNRASTWLRTTSLTIVTPDAARRVAISRRRGARVGDEAGHAGPPERPQGGPDLDLTGPLGGLRGVVHRFELLARWQVAGGRRERAGEVGRPAHERDAAVVRHVEPLVSIGRPRVGAFEPGDEVSSRRVGACPQAERGVDVEPPAALGQPVRDLVEGVECARVHLARLGAHEHRSGQVGEAIGAHPALLVSRHDDDAPTSEAHKAE